MKKMRGESIRRTIPAIGGFLSLNFFHLRLRTNGKKKQKKNEKAYDPPRAGNIFPRVLAKQGDFLSLGYKRRGERESFRDGRIENSYKTFLNIYEISDIYIGN